MDVAGKKIAIVVDNYFEESEFTEPLQAFRQAGIDVQVLGATTAALQAMHHHKPSAQYQADMLLGDADIEDYDALVLPGGALNADTLRMNQTAQKWAKAFMESQKPIAAICHAPWLLVSANVVIGHTLTSYFTIQDDIRNAGGDWVDQPVVVDGNLITSRKPDDIPLFTDKILTMLHDQQEHQLNKEVYDE